MERHDFGWWTHNTIYRYCVKESHILKLYNFIYQCHSNKLNNFLKKDMIKVLMKKSSHTPSSKVLCSI